MGCFNISGFYSHLPIRYGDKIGAIICAQTESSKSGILVNDSTEIGIYPIMAPLYGTYNEYGGIENIENSYTAELFKKLTGHTVDEFITSNYRNDHVTIHSEDNGNPYDNISFYQSIIKHLLPNEKDIDYIVPPAADADTIKQYDKINNALRREYDNAVNSTFLVIYEHVSVLKQLNNIGMKYFKYVPDKSSISYDCIANIVDGIKDSDGKAIENFLNARHGIFMEILKYSPSTDIDKLLIGDVTDLIQALDKQLRDIKLQKMFMRLYKNINILDMAKIKDDFLNLLFVNKGLYQMCGSYNPCVYVGHDIDFDDIKEMHNVLENIINEYKK